MYWNVEMQRSVCHSRNIWSAPGVSCLHITFTPACPGFALRVCVYMCVCAPVCIMFVCMRERERKKSQKKKREGGESIERKAKSKRGKTKKTKNRITHGSRWLGLQTAIFSHALSRRSHKVSVKVRAGCFSGPFFSFPFAQLLFQSPKNTLLHVNGFGFNQPAKN